MSETLSEAAGPEQASQSEIMAAQFEALGVSNDAATRIEQLKTATGAGLMQVAAGIHEIVAPDEVHTPYEGVMHVENPRDGSRRTPLMAPEKRLGHFDHAAGLLQRLAQLEAPDEASKQAVLKRAGNVFALSIVQAHTFEEGNGRTARSAAQLLREGVGESGSEAREDLLVVSANRPSSGFRINSFLPTADGVNLTPAELLDRAAALDIPLADESTYNTQKLANFSSPYAD